MKKRAKTHLLPTDKAKNCIIRYKDGNLTYFQGSMSQNYLKTGDGVIGLDNRSSHHLYITTNDEIKEGDWYVLTKNDGTPTTILKATIDGGSLKFNSEKIIATTDPVLHYNTVEGITDGGRGRVFKEKNIPQLSKAFIEKYCEVGGIDEVDVEYEDPVNTLKLRRAGTMAGKIALRQAIFGLQPKLTSNNEIIIHPIEKKKLFNCL